MSLPNEPQERKKLTNIRDLQTLSSDPDMSRQVANNIGTWLTVVIMLAIAGWMVNDQLVTAMASDQSWSGFEQAMVSAGVIGVMTLIYYAFAFWLPGFFKFPFMPIALFGVGWLVRGIFESSAAVVEVHAGYWAGVWTLSIGIGLLIGLYTVYRFKRS